MMGRGAVGGSNGKPHHVWDNMWKYLAQKDVLGDCWELKLFIWGADTLWRVELGMALIGMMMGIGLGITL